MSATPEQIAERLRTIDGYLNSLWDRAAKLRDQNTGQAHADLNELRHGIGAIPDGLLEAANALTAQAERVRVLEEALNVIAHWDSFSPPLTKNDANIPPEDFPHYVAGRAHAEVALIRNYAGNSITRAALKAAP